MTEFFLLADVCSDGIVPGASADLTRPDAAEVDIALHFLQVLRITPAPVTGARYNSHTLALHAGRWSGTLGGPSSIGDGAMILAAALTGIPQRRNGVGPDTLLACHVPASTAWLFRALEAHERGDSMQAEYAKHAVQKLEIEAGWSTQRPWAVESKATLAPGNWIH